MPGNPGDVPGASARLGVGPWSNWAEQAGMHWTYVGSVERGERNISPVNIVRLDHGLRIGPDELVKGSWP